MRNFALSLVAAGGLLAGLSVFAQELPKAEKRENVQYYQALYVKFKPGKENQGWEAIYEHFINVDKKIGTGVRAYDLQTGPWHQIALFPIDGPDYFTWSTSPQDEKWWAAFAEMEGGADKAQAIWQSFLDAVADMEVHLAHRHLEIDQD